MKRILFILAIILLMPAKCFATADARLSSQDIKNYGCYTAATVSGMTCYQQTVDVGFPTGSSSATVQGAGVDGMTAVGNPVQVGGVDVSGNTQAILTGTDGAQIVNASGDVAHDAADSGNPIKLGAKAVPTDGTDPGEAVAEDDRVNLRASLDGLLLTSEQHPFSWSATEAETGAVTNDAIKAAPGANLSLYVCSLVISNGATAGDYKLVEDTAGTPVTLVEKIYTGVTGGAVMKFSPCIRATANKDIGITSTTVTTGSYTVSGYTAP